MKHTFVLWLFFMPAALFCQQRQIPVTVSVFNQNTSLPFTKFFTSPVHPGLQVGTEFNYRVKKRVRLFQAINLSYFFHNRLAQGIKINTELGYEYRLKNGLAFAGRAGLGYLHSFTTAQEFSFVNGSYEKKTDRGNARVVPSLSLDAGYYFKRSVRNCAQLFIRYETWAEHPYSPGFIPVMLHTNVHIGTKIYSPFHSKK